MDPNDYDNLARNIDNAYQNLGENAYLIGENREHITFDDINSQNSQPINSESLYSSLINEPIEDNSFLDKGQDGTSVGSSYMYSAALQEQYNPGLPIYGDIGTEKDVPKEDEYDPTAVFSSRQNESDDEKQNFITNNVSTIDCSEMLINPDRNGENSQEYNVDSQTPLEENIENQPISPLSLQEEEELQKEKDDEKDENQDNSEDETDKNNSDETSADKMIKDIFGDDSDQEENNEDVQTHHDDNDGEEGTIRSEDEADRSVVRQHWDFDLMMQKKKAERTKRRSNKRRNDIVISDQDDLVKAFVENMKMAANKDRTENEMQRPALEKRKMLPLVIQMVRKADLQEVFLDYGLIDAFSEWLAPLPDKGLPSLEVRQAILKILQDQFLHIEPSIIRKSGIGKALMLIVKHPKETRENKEKARKIIGEWARPIFNLETSYHSVTREEREQRDLDQLPAVKRRRFAQNESSQQDEEEQQEKLRPGDVGFIPRARVPRPSTKDYVRRPRASLDSFKKESKTRGMERYETTLREFKNKNKSAVTKRAVSVNLSGNKIR